MRNKQIRKEQQERESEEIKEQEELTETIKKHKVDRGCVCVCVCVRFHESTPVQPVLHY